MVARLPRVTAREVIRVLHSHGFKEVRSSGSHRIFRNAEGRRTTVPYHAAKVLHPKLLKSILQEAELTPEDLN